MSGFSDAEYKKWAEKQDRKILTQLNVERRKLEMRLESKSSKIITERTSLKLRVKRAIADRFVGARQQIMLLDGKPLKYWKDLAEKGDKNAEARVKAYLIQEEIRAESVEKEFADANQDTQNEEIEYTGEPRLDILETLEE